MLFTKIRTAEAAFFHKILKFITIYKFRIFKKTTRFKRYSFGLTKYIINRKRYQIRKKRSRNLPLYYLGSTWSINYRRLSQAVKCNQLRLSLPNSSLTPSRLFITRKSIQLGYNYVNTVVISKRLLKNSSLFIPPQAKFVYLLSTNSIYSLVLNTGIVKSLDFNRLPPFNNILTGNMSCRYPGNTYASSGLYPMNSINNILTYRVVVILKTFYKVLILLSLILSSMQ